MNSSGFSQYLAGTKNQDCSHRFFIYPSHSRFLCTPGRCIATRAPFGMGIRFVSLLNEFPTVIEVVSGAVLNTNKTCEYHETRDQI